MTSIRHAAIDLLDAIATAVFDVQIRDGLLQREIDLVRDDERDAWMAEATGARLMAEEANRLAEPARAVAEADLQFENCQLCGAHFSRHHGPSCPLGRYIAAKTSRDDDECSPFRSESFLNSTPAAVRGEAGNSSKKGGA